MARLDKAAPHLIGCGFLLISLLYFQNVYEGFIIPKQLAFLAIALTISLVALLRQKPSIIIERRQTFTLAVLVLSYLLSVWNSSSYATLEPTFEWTAFIAIVILSFQSHFVSESSARQTIAQYLLSNILCLLIVSGVRLWQGRNISASFGNTYICASYLGFLLTAFGFLTARKLHRIHPIIYGPILAAGFVAFLAQNSRGSILAVFFAGAWAVLVLSKTNLNRIRRLGLYLVASAALLFIVPYAIDALVPQQKYIGAFFLKKKTNSVFTRLRVWRQTSAMIHDYPLGVGPGNFEYLFPRYGESDSGAIFRSPHNGFFEIASENGILAVATLIALILGALLKRIEKDEGLIHFTSTVMIYFIVDACFGFPLELYPTFYAAAVVLGVRMSSFPHAHTKSFKVGRIPQTALLVTSFLGCAYFLSIHSISYYLTTFDGQNLTSLKSACSIDPFEWRYCLWTAQRERKEESTEVAIETLKRALAFNPKNIWLETELHSIPGY